MSTFKPNLSHVIPEGLPSPDSVLQSQLTNDDISPLAPRALLPISMIEAAFSWDNPYHNSLKPMQPSECRDITHFPFSQPSSIKASTESGSEPESELVPERRCSSASRFRWPIMQLPPSKITTFNSESIILIQLWTDYLCAHCDERAQAIPTCAQLGRVQGKQLEKEE